jgi:hypothetical protein
VQELSFAHELDNVVQIERRDTVSLGNRRYRLVGTNLLESLLQIDCVITVEQCQKLCGLLVEFANRILVEEENNWENYSFLFCLLLPYASKEISQNFSKKILLIKISL